MRLGRGAIGPSLCDEVSLSNQLTPSDAGNPAPTPDRPANGRLAWRLDVPTPLSRQMQVAATCRAPPNRASAVEHLPDGLASPIGVAKLRPAQRS
ncbi:hypothetical protein CIB48_g6519, partial [Xylaria polymorpha]